ncbi:MAG: iron-containing redox enzyme family protein [Steroidobacteraceae bacterium]
MQATEAPTYEMIDPQTSGRLKESIAGHEGMAILEKAFGTGLKRAPLSRAALERFLACHVAFVRDVPTSILTVANRLSHACMKFDYFGGHSIAARTLFAAVHEYGLQNTEVGFAKTHFELYRDGIRSFGFDEKAILSNKSIFPEAVEMADWNENLAQNAPLAKALGAHVALEATADREFLLLWEGFSKYWQAYNLKGIEDPALGFYHIHIVQETQHAELSVEALDKYLAFRPNEAALALDGCNEFLAVYCKCMKAFDRAFFS